MNLSSKKALILSLPMILAVFLLGGWFLFREQKVSEESSKPPVVGENLTQNPGNIEPSTNVDTSNWKTYRNEEYGFEVKYPAEWVVFNDYPDRNQVFISLPENDDFRVDGVTIYMGKAATLTPEAVIQSIPKGGTGFGAIVNDSKVVLDGSVEGRQIILDRAIGDKISLLFLSKGSDKYVIRNSLFLGGEPCKFCESIVETFKFLKKWNVYKSEEHGFEIQYSRETVELADDVFEDGTEGAPSFRLKNGGHLSMGVWPNTKDETAKEFLDNRYLEYSGGWLGTFEATSFDPNQKLAFKAIRKMDDCLIEWNIIPYKQKMYTFRLEVCGSEDGGSQAVGILHDIARTLHFSK